MTALHDRLADLADQVDPTPGPPAPDLWRTGKRRARQRRALASVGALAAVAALALGSGAVATRLQSEPVQPAGSPERLAVPDQVYAGNSWLPRGSEGGAGGPIAAVTPGQRTTWFDGPRLDLLAISAVDQEYRWLDLPGFPPVQPDGTAQGWSLSPDGRYVAYWQGSDLVTFDATTGDVHRRTFELADGASPLGWTGSKVWGCPATASDGGYSCASAFRMDAATGAVTDVRGRAVGVDSSYVPGPDGSLVATKRAGGRTLVFQLRADSSGTDRPLTRVESALDDTETTIDSVALSPDGSRLALTRAGKIRVGTVQPRGTTPTTQVPVSGGFHVLLGWRDATHVVATGSQGLVSVDVTTGEREPLVRAGSADIPAVAADLLVEPTVAGVRPPSPIDPRLLTVLVGLGGGLLVVLGFWLRRRRAR